jgi:hypothetical protein
MKEKHRSTKSLLLSSTWEAESLTSGPIDHIRHGPDELQSMKTIEFFSDADSSRSKGNLDHIQTQQLTRYLFISNKTICYLDAFTPQRMPVPISTQ